MTFTIHTAVVMKWMVLGEEGRNDGALVPVSDVQRQIVERTTEGRKPRSIRIGAEGYDREC